MELTTHSLRPQIERMQRAWRRSPVPRFLAWWAGELAACLPARWRQAWLRGRCWRYVRLEASHWQLWAPAGDAPLLEQSLSSAPALQQAALAEACSDVDAADLRLMLWLAPEQVLRRRLLLPEAALERLNQVVGFEMDRQTPFRAQDVYFDVREDVGSAPEGQVAVELVVTPRAPLDDALARLAAMQVKVDAVDTVIDGRRLGVNLLPALLRPRRAHPWRRRNGWLALAVLVLIVACMAQWVHNRRQVLAQMQTQVDTLRTQARQVATLRRRLSERAQAAGFLAQRKARSPTVLAVLADLSQRIPTDTWLERFSVSDDGRVGLQGQGPQAAGLIERVKASPLLDEPQIQGSIQSDPRTHKERFFIAAQLHDAGAAKGGAHAHGSH